MFEQQDCLSITYYNVVGTFVPSVAFCMPPGFNAVTVEPIPVSGTPDADLDVTDSSQPGSGFRSTTDTAGAVAGLSGASINKYVVVNVQPYVKPNLTVRSGVWNLKVSATFAVNIVNVDSNQGTAAAVTGAWPVQVVSRRTLVVASINLSASGDNTVIAAPGSGSFIHLVHLDLQNTGTVSQTAIVKNDATAINGAGALLNPYGGGYTFDGEVGLRELVLADNAPLKVNLSATPAGGNVIGTAIYYVATTAVS